MIEWFGRAAHAEALHFFLIFTSNWIIGDRPLQTVMLDKALHLVAAVPSPKVRKQAVERELVTFSWWSRQIYKILTDTRRLQSGCGMATLCYTGQANKRLACMRQIQFSPKRFLAESLPEKVA